MIFEDASEGLLLEELFLLSHGSVLEQGSGVEIHGPTPALLNYYLSNTLTQAKLNKLWSESLDLPFSLCGLVRVAEPVVAPVPLALPELERLRHDSVASPEIRPFENQLSRLDFLGCFVYLRKLA